MFNRNKIATMLRDIVGVTEIPAGLTVASHLALLGFIAGGGAWLLEIWLDLTRGFWKVATGLIDVQITQKTADYFTALLFFSALFFRSDRPPNVAQVRKIFLFPTALFLACLTVFIIAAAPRQDLFEIGQLISISLWLGLIQNDIYIVVSATVFIGFILTSLGFSVQRSVELFSLWAIFIVVTAIIVIFVSFPASPNSNTCLASRGAAACLQEVMDNLSDVDFGLPWWLNLVYWILLSCAASYLVSIGSSGNAFPKLNYRGQRLKPQLGPWGTYYGWVSVSFRERFIDAIARNFFASFVFIQPIIFLAYILSLRNRTFFDLTDPNWTSSQRNDVSELAPFLVLLMWFVAFYRPWRLIRVSALVALILVIAFLWDSGSNLIDFFVQEGQ